MLKAAGTQPLLFYCLHPPLHMPAFTLHGIDAKTFSCIFKIGKKAGGIILKGLSSKVAICQTILPFISGHFFDYSGGYFFGLVCLLIYCKVFSLFLMSYYSFSNKLTES